MAVRKWIRWACFGGAVALAGAAAVGPSSDAASTALPETFNGYAYATGVHFSLNTDPAQTIPELVRIDLPHGESAIGSGSVARGRASFAYPGSSGDAATFLCQVGWPCDQFAPPNWPFTARAEYPFQPHGEAQAQGPGIDEGHLQLSAGRSVADAVEDSVRTQATAGKVLFGNLGTGALTPATALLSIGSSEAVTTHRFEGDVLVTRAEVVLKDVGIAGGALQIASIVASSESRSNGADTVASTPDVLIGGATLGGQQVAITEKGIEAAGDPQDSGALRSVTGGFAQLLSNGTIDLRLIGAEEEIDGSTANGAVTGIAVDYRIDGRGFPAGTALVGGFLLGNASTSARVSLDEGFGGFDDGLDPDLGGFVGADDGDSSVLGGGFPNAGPAGGLADFPTPGDEPGGGGSFSDDGDSTSRQPAPGPLERLSENVADRVGLLYGAAALAALGLAVGLRAPGLRL